MSSKAHYNPNTQWHNNNRHQQPVQHKKTTDKTKNMTKPEILQPIRRREITLSTSLVVCNKTVICSNFKIIQSSVLQRPADCRKVKTHILLYKNDHVCDPTFRGHVHWMKICCTTWV